MQFEITFIINMSFHMKTSGPLPLSILRHLVLKEERIVLRSHNLWHKVTQNLPFIDNLPRIPQRFNFLIRGKKLKRFLSLHVQSYSVDLGDFLSHSYMYRAFNHISWVVYMLVGFKIKKSMRKLSLILR